MPVRLVSVPTDWENEIAAWAVTTYNETDYKPSTSPYTLGSAAGNIGAPTLVDGSFASNKTIKIYLKAILDSKATITHYTRLYNHTTTTTITSLSHVGAGTKVLTVVTGNPIVNYSYDANDRINPQARGSGGNYGVYGIFAARIVDR